MSRVIDDIKRIEKADTFRGYISRTMKLVEHRPRGRRPADGSLDNVLYVLYNRETGDTVSYGYGLNGRAHTITQFKLHEKWENSK